MKLPHLSSLLIALLLSALVPNAFSQGTVNFSNLGASVLQAPGKGGGVVPAGNAFMAALCYAPAGETDPAAFAQVGAAVPFLAPGIFLGGTRTAPVTPPGAIANFLVKVWEVADPMHKGISSIITVDTSDPTSIPPGPPASLIVAGLTTIQMTTTTCPGLSITCTPNGTNECTGITTPLSYTPPTALDGCGNSLIVVCTPTNGTPVQLGIATIRCQPAGQTNTCSFTVTIQDTVAPTITCPGPISMECTNSNGTIATYNATATDICDPNPTVTCIPPSGSLFALGANTVTCSASDASGNTNACSFTVTLFDTTAPDITCPSDIIAECTNATGTAVSFSATATDICDPNPTVACIPTSGSLFALGTNTVTCSASDASGNTNACSFNVTVVDTTAPNITCPADIVAECTSSTGTAVSFSTTATDICDPNPTVACIPPSGSLFAQGTNTVTCSASDASGNTNACTFNITVVDTTAPDITCPADIIAECTSATGTAVSFSTTATDLCDPNPAVTCIPPSGSLFAMGTNTVTCSASDASGNTNACSFDITVVDTTAPAITCPSDIIAECTNAIGIAASFVATAIDTCDPNPIVTCVPPSGSLFAQGTNVVTCSASDASGNTNACSFNVTLFDTTAPDITCPADIIAECTNTAGTAVSFSTTATDICDPNPTVTCVPPSGSLFTQGTNTVICSASDASGNTNACSFTVTLFDATAPDITCPADIIAECTNATGTAVSFSATATDICDPNPTVACIPPSGSLFALGTNTVTCSASDASGNTNACTFNITVVDTTAPDITCPADIIAECTSATGTAVSFSTTATDLCDPNPTVTCIPPSGSLFAMGTNTVTCSASDASGNTNACSFDITVVDTTAPAITCPSDIIAECTNAIGIAASFVATATDTCDLNPIVTCVPPSGSLFAQGTNIVTCSASDASGNTNACSFNVTLFDTTAPDITCPADIIAECTNTAGTAVSFSTTATDICDPNPVVTCIPPSGSLFAQGTNTVTCSASDASGNTNACSFNVTLFDATAPDITCPADIIAECTNATGTAVSFSTTATDICDPNPTVTCIPPSGSLFALGTNTVTCSASDASGNTNACSFTITLLDTVAPNITCPADIVAECTNAAGTAVSFSTTATDIYDPNPTVTCIPPSGSLFAMGTNTVTCSAIDASGNTNACSFDITVVDTTAPAITCPSDIIAECTNAIGIAASFVATAIDTCDPNPIVTCVPPSGSLFAQGTNIVTCSASDASGNTNSCSFNVTLFDTTAPDITCPADIIAECTNTAGTAVSFSTTATDICDPNPTVTCIPPSGSLFALGTNTVTCSASDASGNTNACSFTVTLFDATAPDITCPADIIAECTSATGTAVSFSTTATDICDPNPTVTCIPPSGSLFAMGTNTVTCSAIDASGNTNACSFDITVVDSTAPDIICPANFSFSTTNANGANVPFSLTATDLCDPSPVVTCIPPSGSLFAQGANTVTCSAFDASGNTNTCSFTVTVNFAVTVIVTRPFVVATQPGDIKNNFSGHVGFKITTGTNRLCVTDLGSIVVPGNTVSNEVRIFRTLDKVQIASSFVQPGGATPGSYNYTPLNTPVILNSNTMYYVVMSVTNGVNMYYDVTKTTITTTADAIPNSGIFEGSGYAWSPSGGAGQSYGVPNFKYYVITTNAPAPPPEPQIVISDPADLSIFTAPAAFTVTADATPDVISVQFCQNGTNITVDNTFPFSADVSNLGVGNYEYVAKGTTPQGIVITSAVVRVTIATNTPLTNDCYVTNIVSLGASRNEFTGLVGKKITIGPNDLKLTHLSRYVLPGNNRPHQVKVVDAAFNDVPGASVVVRTTNCPPNQFKFSALANNVTLLAGQSYYIVSAETAGGDKFSDFNSTVIQVTGVARCDGPVYFAPGAGWTTIGSSQTYGPVNFKYIIGPPPSKIIDITSPANGVVLTDPPSLTIRASASPDIVNVTFYILEEGSSIPNLVDSVNSRPFNLTIRNPLTNPGIGTHRLTVVGTDTNNCSVTSSVVTITLTTNSVSTSTNCFILSNVLGDMRNNFSGWVGYKFTTGSNTLSIGRLGRIISPGNSQSHTVKVVRAASPNLDIAGASVVINTAFGTPGQFKYENFANPLVLSPNTMYYLISAETIGGDTWHDVNKTVLLPAAVASIDSGVYMGNGIKWSLGGPSNHGYVPLDFKYAVIQQATFNAAKGGGSVEANVTPTLQCQPGPDGMAVTLKGAAGMKVTLQASDDLVHWKTIATHTMERDELRIADVEGIQSHRFYRLR